MWTNWKRRSTKKQVGGIVWDGWRHVRHRTGNEEGNARATLAFDVFVHRLRASIGPMLASLGGLDASVFTDGISQDEPVMRAAICAPFGFLGLALDQSKNESTPLDADIATSVARIRVVIVKS